MLAGRMSDKMSSELGYYFMVMTGFFILGDCHEKHKSYIDPLGSRRP